MNKTNKKIVILGCCSVLALLKSVNAAAFDFSSYFECLMSCGGSCTFDGVCYSIEK